MAGIVPNCDEKHILVAEDQPLHRMILSRQLSQVFGRSSISFVGCGEEAAKALRGEEYLATSPDGHDSWMEKPSQFDVAFLDHNMPVTNDGDPRDGVGVQVAEEIKRTRSAEDHPCFLVSHSSRELDEMEAGIWSVFDSVIQKPAPKKSYEEIARKIGSSSHPKA